MVPEKLQRAIRPVVAVVTLFLIAPVVHAGAPDIRIAAGIVLENNFYLAPGLRVTAESPRILRGHPQAILTYTTSRAALWNGKNDLPIDDILLCLAWHFRPGRTIDPFAGIDIGYLRFDREDDEKFALIQNSFARCNVRLGLRSYLLQGRLQPAVEAGYVVVQNSVTFPLFFSFAVCYEIVKGARQ